MICHNVVHQKMNDGLWHMKFVDVRRHFHERMNMGLDRLAQDRRDCRLKMSMDRWKMDRVDVLHHRLMMNMGLA